MTEGRLNIRWYEVLYVVLLVVFVAMSIYFASRPKVGLIDMRKVSEELGVNEQRAEEYAAWRVEALERIKAVNSTADQRIADVEAKLKKTRRKADKERLSTEVAELQNGRRKSIERINMELAERWRAASISFRKKLEPIINNVARKKRLDMVLEIGKVGVTYVNRRVVITDLVVAEALAGAPGGRFLDALETGQDSETEAADRE